ncbi:MAG: TonB family protein [Acidobacteria bacterium]|nr:TonB family protein [Acidobacteriota bacterium]
MAELQPPPVTIEQPKLVVPKDLPKPKPQPEKIQAPEVRPTNVEAPKLPPVSGALPKTIHTGSFGSSAVPTVNAPIQKVQTGGFGDPAGLPGVGKQGARLTANALGSFDLPQGPGVGNGTGGAKGIKGTVASAGFGNGVALPGQGDGRRNGQGVQSAGFGSQPIATNTGKRVADDGGPPTTPVEILSKPNPVYTEEARKLNLEGEVLLEVMFGANGELKVNRVLRGLGHGLDEAAVNAAGKIKFKPAVRNGTPVDSTAVVHVLFQLAS